MKGLLMIFLIVYLTIHVVATGFVGDSKGSTSSMNQLSLGKQMYDLYSYLLYKLTEISVGQNTKTSVFQWMIPGIEFKVFAHYAQAAYVLQTEWNCVPNCLLHETKGTVIDYTWHNVLPASVGYVGHNSHTKIIVISFRGSADSSDWVQDSEFSFEPWPPHFPGSMVHYGFLNSYQAVAGKVTKKVIELSKKHPSYKVVFTGHSLGGAESVLCAVDVLKQYPQLKDKMHIYTYGMPRVGNKEWAESIDNLGIPIYRVVYENDLVPHIPFQWLGYQHFSNEVWIHNNKTVFCGPESESPRCSASVSLADYSVPDHSQYTHSSWQFGF